MPSPPFFKHALPRRLLPLAYALGAMVALILFLTWIALEAQVAVASFLNGETIWSKAQKQAVIELDAYALTGQASHYRKFMEKYGLMESDRRGRNAVMQPTYNKREVTQAFRRGDVMLSAENGMIILLRYFAWAPYLHQSLADWRATDAPIHELGVVANELKSGYASGTLTAAQTARLRARISAINAKLAPISADFSMTLAKGAEWMGRVLFFGVLAAACIACLLWLLLARRVLARIRSSDERYRLLFDSAADAIVMVDEDSGRILDANRTTGVWTGRDPPTLLGEPFAALFAHGAPPDGFSPSGELRDCGGHVRPVETQSSVTAWGGRMVRQAFIRDVSERVESERKRRVSAEALASIAEGVIIADAQRRVVSANAAATRLTGFTLADLMGMRLDDTRTAADGSPLPAGLWHEVEVSRYWSGEARSRREDGTQYLERINISAIRDDDQHIQHYVAVFSDISVAKADRRRLEHLAAHDALTGLVNRGEFQRHCDEAIRLADLRRHVVAVLFIDLDAFKFVNDSYSHAVGDLLLGLVGDRIVVELREGDIAGRIGGDEFTVLLPVLEMREDAATLADRILSALSEPFVIDGYELMVSASIGIAGYPLDGNDAKTLVANADAAMYAAKSEERNAWRFYVPMMRADASRRMALANELRQALLDDEFELVYQPSVELHSGRTVGVEALLRWHHPERGEMLPDEFIPIAERIGLIHRIDEWVMHAVCARIHAWDESGVPPIRVAINVSARWLGHAAFVDSVRHALQTNDVAPQRVVLELTESAILRLEENTERTMRALHALGIAVAVDDFGTGYASMAYLKLPAVAYVKIDRSFVTGLPDDTNDAAIARAILAMAKSLGLVAIAEGVENEAQHKFLVGAGCIEGQGYLYSYPVPPAVIARMLRPKHQHAGTELKLVPRYRD